MLIAAFEGWNDATGASVETIEHLAEQWGATRIGHLDPDPYYDFQVNRPTLTRTEDGGRHIEWPTTHFTACSPDGATRDVVLLHGIEPNMRWGSFCEEILELCHSLEVDQVILLGALLSDVAYKRPLPVSGTAADEGLVQRLKLTPSAYEGPTGIVGVLQEAIGRAGLNVVSLWVHIPHYAAASPCPKATLALAGRLEEILDIPVPTGGLVEDTAEWENSIAELAGSDAEIAEYIESLERQDDQPSPQPDGDEIARDFERYLRRRQGGDHTE
ncbi:carboxylate--amine ligase [Actinorhabdospora filicis]|uniref:Carboxylate--amine ligase n=1 Tax=Actinorhabdospora filicis TaxID=1785913 RepID=A0A9W6SQZ1_9ACTN|nr:carboxylate--amine ligase [Actinorhabdospora filicis]